MTWRIEVGDCRDVLRQMPAGSVHTVVTSPPYFGLRDYGTEGQIGLEPTPDEFVAALVDVFREVRRVLRDDGTVWLNLGDSYSAAPKGNPGDWGTIGRPNVTRVEQAGAYRKDNLPGVKPKDLIGIPWLVAFALRSDGWYLRSDIIWSKPNPMPESVTDRPTKAHEMVFLLAKGGKWKTRVVECADLPSECLHLGADLSAKRPDLVAGDFGVRLATAILDRAKAQQAFRLRVLDAQIREQGGTRNGGSAIGDLPVEHWAPVLAARLLRSEIAPKEFLCELHRRGVALTDSDQLLVGDGLSPVPLPPGVARYGEGTIAIHHAGQVRELDLAHNRIVLSTPPTSCSYFYDADAIREPYAPDSEARNGRHPTVGVVPDRNDAGGFAGLRPGAGGANKRSVWTVATQPYAGAHFATFPPKLIEPCILAGAPERACGECGAPWVRVVERELRDTEGWGKASKDHHAGVQGSDAVTRNGQGRAGDSVVRTLGFEPSCPHDDGSASGVVLDPFAGAGTTGLVALQYGREFVGIELNPEYARMARDRIETAVRLGFRAPQNGREQIPGQLDIFGVAQPNAGA